MVVGGGAAEAPSGGGVDAEALLSVARLIQEAGQALWSDAGRAQRCMRQAVALLEAGAPRGDRDVRATERSNVSALAPWQIARALTFLDENLAGKITLQQLAAATRLSVSYFSRAFRVTMGERPYTFVTLRRISKARSLLLSTEMPLSDVALECGLTDQAHLSRVFRRYVGVSPAAWRKMHGAAPAHVVSLSDESSAFRS